MFNFHSCSVEASFKELKSKKEGLSQKEAKARLANGLNKLDEEKPMSALAIFFSQFRNPLIYILIAAGSISFMLHEVVDAGVIFGAVLLNSVIGFIQENKANN